MQSLDNPDHPIYLRCAESGVAISATVHEDQAKYKKLYNSVAHLPEFSGFPGIFNYVAHCACQLEEQWPNVEDNWLPVCAQIGLDILQLEKYQMPATLVALAIETIKTKSIKNGLS